MNGFPRSDDPPPLEGDLEFQVVDWFVPENDKSKQKRDRDEGYPRPAVPCAPAEYEIFMFGATADGHSVTAKVKGFMPYFYVKVPQTWRQDDVDALKERLLYDKVEMRKANGDTYMSTVVRYTLREAGHLADMTLEDHKDFWGFTNFADFKFMRVTVKSLRLYNDLKRYFMMKSHIYQLYESNIDPFLRFIHERDIQPCGWVRIPEGGYDVIDPDASDSEGSGSDAEADEDLPPWERKQRPLKPTVTPCHARTNYCIEVDYDNVHGLGYNKIAPLLIASFDIECTSSHGDFPVAIKNYRKLTIDLIALSRRRTSEITKEELCRLVPLAFFDSTDPSFVNPISRLYAKKAKSLTLEAITAKLAPIADEILLKLKAALKGKSRAKASADDIDAEAESDDETSVRPSLAAAAAEAELTALLTKHLPALAGDPVIQIGTTVHRYGSDKIIYRHIATYKSCADIPDAEVEAKKKESECIMAWKDMITRLDPDIITGYNIFGFDAKYIADRARELGIYDEFVFGLGRLKNRHCDLEERKLSSSALGDNIMYCFDLDGVVQIDMLKVMQRDHKLDSYKLDSVAGKFIVESAQVLSITQPSLNAEYAANAMDASDSDSETETTGLDVFRVGAILKTENTSGLKDGNYIRLDGSDKIRVLAVNDGEGTITLADPLPDGISGLSVGQKLKWALVKDDISPNEIFAKFGGNSRDRMEIAKYCLQDCALVNRLLHKLKVMENNIGMGNVCYVPLSYLFMRGQGVKIFSLVARECRLKNHLIPVVRSARDTITDGDSDAVGYEGAIVLPPQEGMYLDDPITVLDYSSLYPSSMISRNISHDAYVFPETSATTLEAAAEAGVTFHDITFDEYEGTGDKKRIKGQKTCTFAQLPDGRKGIIPSILQMLLTQRKNTRKKIEYETLTLTSGEEITGLVKDCDDSLSLCVTDVDTGKTRTVLKDTVTSRRDTFNEFEKAVLDARQLAYKVTANSLYGQTGSRTSPIFLLEVAACTTATGRNMIMLAKGFVESEYGAEVIYGDTDSIFCRFKNDGLKGKDALPLAIAAGQRASREIKAHLPPPQCLEYEKTLWPFILFSKKRYVGNLYEDDHLKKPKQKSMGIVLKRRDNAQIVKIIYGGIIDILMKEGSLAESIAFLKKSLQDLVDGKVPLEHLVISKTLKGDYKDPTKIAHRVLADRIGERDPGNKPMVNDRVPFVYIIPPASVVAPILQGDRIEHPDFIRQENLKPDYQFYITNQLLKPISQLYALCVTQIDGYSLVPNYWLQIDAELEGTPMYSNDKKRKDRIGRMKMKEVKELLFDPYIEALASPSRPRKKAARKAKEKTGTEDLCEYILDIKAVEKKRGAQYECTVTFTRNGSNDTPVWTIEKIYKGKKAETLRMAAVEGVNKIATDADSPEDAPMFAVTCADKTFLRGWRAALKAQASAEGGDDTDPLDGMKNVRTTLDMSALDEQRELNGFTGLVNARQRLNYILL